ncbi:MAG TPA: ABC transporter ATP-binding protein [Acidimicrobiales bacterium]|nr:ABC transporter ATP-binding protein [Acidimicrobiales bacterium]
MSHAPLSVKDLDAGHQDGPRLLRGVTFHLRPGEVVALVGANGSGKTTLLRTAVGLLRARSGSTAIFGHRPESIEARAALSFVADTPIFYDGVTVAENLEFVGRLHGVEALPTSPVVHALGVGPLLESFPARLSHGQRQRVALAMGLARPWRLAVLDEPTLGLDSESRARIATLLLRMRNEGRTVVIATHDADLIERSDRAAVITDGALEWHAGPQSAAQVLTP